MPITSFIRRLETFTKLSDPEKEALKSLPVREVDIQADHEIVREGDVPTRMCFVISGMACSFRMAAEARRQIVNFHLVGDAPDLLGLHLDVLDINIATITPCRLGFIHHDAIRELCSRHPRVTTALWRHTLIEGVIYRSWMTNIGQRDAHSR